MSKELLQFIKKTVFLLRYLFRSQKSCGDRFLTGSAAAYNIYFFRLSLNSLLFTRISASGLERCINCSTLETSLGVNFTIGI